MATLLPIVTILENLGFDPVEMLTGAGCDPKLFDNPDNLISYAARSQLVGHCVAQTGCGHFGLLLGQQSGLASLGLVGYLAQNSPDVRTALESLERYFRLHVHGGEVHLASDRGWAALRYEITELRTEASEYIYDAAVAVMFNVMRELCGPDWKPTQVLLGHRRPADVRPFQRFFMAPLIFDAEQNALQFSTDCLSQRLPAPDLELRRLLQKQIDTLETQHRDDFPTQVKTVLRTAILTGHATEDHVAEMFSLHTRTLRRRLKEYRLSFRELVDECRFEIARQWLETSDKDVSKIAASLNYADASAFTRAFRRWSGTTPTEWRASNQ